VKNEYRKAKIEKRHSEDRRRLGPRFPSSRFSIFDFRFSLLILLAVLCEASCAAPAEPQPPHPVVPAVVTDLAARQRGDGGLLTFTPPSKNVEGERLAAPPSMEILRGFAPGGAQAPPSGSLGIVYTVPGQLLDTYLAGERVEFQDPIKPEEIARHSGERMFYVVRGRISKRAASEDSNVASFLVRLAPTPISDVRATVVEAGVELSWEPPATVSGGASLTTLGSYRIYRAEAATGAQGGSARTPQVLAGISPSPNYLDTQIEWGKTYQYTVRSVAQYGAEAVESGESRGVEVTPKDIFPPAPPLDLVVVFVPAAGATPAAVELSWAISPEADAAGYYVYRTGEGQEKPQRVTPTLLPTPAFRDIHVVPGAVYTYAITAVDRAGNESQPSKSVSVRIPKAGD
jgi:hypothetical protein